MKIPMNPQGPNPFRTDGNLENKSSASRTGGTAKSFDAHRAGSVGAQPDEASRLSVNAEWHRSQLDDPQALHSMIEASIGQLLQSSAVAGRFSEDQRAALGQQLAGDPVLRELLTQHLERSLS